MSGPGRLVDRHLTEFFAGDPKAGGSNLSRIWCQEGGAATPRDTCIDLQHNFLKGDAFWKSELKHKQKRTFQYAPPCTAVSKANSTPAIRSMENPYGAPDREACRHANEIFFQMFRRMLEAILNGHHVLMENPLMSYLWVFPELLQILGMAGMYLVRIGHCTCGTPYQKPQLWLTTCPDLLAEGAVCAHPNNAHPEHLVGGTRARRTAPYPEDLGRKICKAFSRMYSEGRATVDPNLSKVAGYLLHRLYKAGGQAQTPARKSVETSGA